MDKINHITSLRVLSFFSTFPSSPCSFHLLCLVSEWTWMQDYIRLHFAIVQTKDDDILRRVARECNWCWDCCSQLNREHALHIVLIVYFPNKNDTIPCPYDDACWRRNSLNCNTGYLLTCSHSVWEDFSEWILGINNISYVCSRVVHSDVPLGLSDAKLLNIPIVYRNKQFRMQHQGRSPTRHGWQFHGEPVVGGPYTCASLHPRAWYHRYLLRDQ